MFLLLRSVLLTITLLATMASCYRGVPSPDPAPILRSADFDCSYFLVKKVSQCVQEVQTQVTKTAAPGKGGP